jgi:hypothetical protein
MSSSRAASSSVVCCCSCRRRSLSRSRSRSCRRSSISMLGQVDVIAFRHYEDGLDNGRRRTSREDNDAWGRRGGDGSRRDGGAGGKFYTINLEGSWKRRSGRRVGARRSTRPREGKAAVRRGGIAHSPDCWMAMSYGPIGETFKLEYYF